MQPLWIDTINISGAKRCPRCPQPLSAQPPTPSATPKERLDGHASDARGFPRIPSGKKGISQAKTSIYSGFSLETSIFFGDIPVFPWVFP